MDECLYYYPLWETTLGGACVTVTCFASAFSSQYSIFFQSCIFQHNGKTAPTINSTTIFWLWDKKKTKHRHAEMNSQLPFSSCLLKLQRKAVLGRVTVLASDTSSAPTGLSNTSSTGHLANTSGDCLGMLLSRASGCLSLHPSPSVPGLSRGVDSIVGYAMGGWVCPGSQKLLYLTITALTTGTCWLESKVAPWCLIDFVSNLDKFIPDCLLHITTTPASSSHGGVTPRIYTKYEVWGGQGIKAGLSWSSSGCALWELRKQQYSILCPHFTHSLKAKARNDCATRLVSSW